MLNTLRYLHELRDASRLDLPQTNGKKGDVSSREIKMAEQLVETMMAEWRPEKYRDEYRDDLLNFIEKKVKAGQTKEVESAAQAARPKRQGKVFNMMHRLRQSVKQAESKEGTTRQRKAS